VIRVLQWLPLKWVAWLGRLGGAMAYRLDGRHRRVAIGNLSRCFGAEQSPGALRALARENFRRLGENFASSVKTASMDAVQVRRILEVVGAEKFPAGSGPQARSLIIAIGHFGNFELYAHAAQFVPGYQFATTYRALPQPALNRLLQELREQSGCLYFERLSEAGAMRDALQKQRLLLGFLADQHGGDRGLPVPFLGRDCSTGAAPAVYALRYDLPLFTAICYRVGLGRWRIEVGEEIPLREEGRARSPESIMGDVNRAFELAVRRDPANWFWVHRRWKPGKSRRRRNSTGDGSRLEQSDAVGQNGPDATRQT